MAGALTISTLNNDTGVLQTQNGMTGIAKAWVFFNGVSTTSIYQSFNVSSVTFISGGVYQINFTTAMPNLNYAFAGSGEAAGSGVSVQQNTASNQTFPTTTQKSATQLQIVTSIGNTPTSCIAISCIVFSS
jgi:hypothetical protein